MQPKFGASLQVLKVEIGGDSQASGNRLTSHKAVVVLNCVCPSLRNMCRLWQNETTYHWYSDTAWYLQLLPLDVCASAVLMVKKVAVCETCGQWHTERTYCTLLLSPPKMVQNMIVLLLGIKLNFCWNKSATKNCLCENIQLEGCRKIIHLWIIHRWQ